MSLLEQLHRDLLHAGVFPEKRFSQNFLVSETVRDDLVAHAKITPKSVVLEIGGGTGIVTEKLAETGAKIFVLEVHPALANHLQQKFSAYKNVHILEKDFLHTKLEEIPFTHVCCSPPYAIADDIMLGLYAHGFKHAAMVWQYEFADKVLSSPGSKDYGPLSVIGQYFFDGNVSRKISPQSFYPSPNQFSAILSLHARPRTQKIEHYDDFVKFLRTVFRFRNKTMGNAIQKALQHWKAPLSTEKILSIIQEMDLAEEKVFLVEPEEWVELFRRMHAEKE